MPAKGSRRKFPNRKNFLRRDIYERYVKTSGDNVSWEEFEKIASGLLEYIAESVLTDTLGFRLPVGLGYMSVTKFKTPDHYIDLVHFSKTGERKPLLNRHTFEETCKIRWWKAAIATFKHHRVYKFAASKEFNYKLRDKIYEGKEYDYLANQIYISDAVLQNITDNKTRYVHE